MTSLRTRAAGLVGLVVIGAIVATLLAVYFKTFKSVTDVTVMTDRAGLLLDKGSSVRVHGVTVGEVRAVRQAGADRVAVSIAVDPSAARLIPEDVTASIRATTVFGAKFVDLVVPGGGVDSAASLRAGQVIQGEHVTVEANDVFQHSVRLLGAVDPRQLSTTLTAVASALDGRGKAIGSYLALVNRYLASFNGHLPQLRADVATVGDVVRTYNAAAPGLIRAADSASTTSITLNENLASLQAFLVDIVDASGETGSFLQRLDHPLRSSMGELEPVTTLFRTYSPELGCLIRDMAVLDKGIATALGKNDPGVQGRAGFLPGQPAYNPQQNLPKLVSGVGPICYPMTTASHPLPPHVRFNDGTKTVYDGIGPVVNPGSLHDPYGRAHDPGSPPDGSRSYQNFLNFLLGPQAGAQLGQILGSGK